MKNCADSGVRIYSSGRGMFRILQGGRVIGFAADYRFAKTRAAELDKRPHRENSHE